MINNNKKFKVCLLGAKFSTGNMGVGALIAGAIKAILHYRPDAEIILLDYNQDRLVYDFQLGGRSISIPLINLRFSKKVFLRNNIAVLLLLALFLRLVPFKKLKGKILSENFYLNHIASSSIVAALAGGDSFSDIYGLPRLIYVALPQLLVLLMGKNLVLLPQTLGPFMGKPAKAMARYILRRAGLAYSRDYPGLQETREFMGPKIHAERLKFCYDLGFVVDPLPPEKLNLDGFCERKKAAGCVAGFNVSGLLFMGGYSRNNMFGLKADYQKLVYAILELLMQKPEAAVVLVPHVFGAATLQESDARVCEKIYDELKTQYENRLFFARGGYNQNEIKHIIGFCDFFIGSRMHACIAALSQNIPAVAIAYSKKFWGVMQTIGVEALVADPREMENAAILRHVDEAYERRGEWRAQLQHTVPQVKATVLNLFADIAESENHQRPTSR